MTSFFVVLSVVLGIVIVGLPLAYAVLGDQRPELPEPGRRADVGGGVCVNLLDHGAGPTLVLIHGISSNAYDWRLSIEALAKRGFRVLAYDRVGYGRSDARSDGRFTFDENAAELLALLEAEELQDATVVGWSYGGGVAVRAALRDSSRIGRLVLVGSAGPLDDPPRPPLIARILFSRPVRTWIRWVPPVRAGLRRMGSDFSFSGQNYPEWWLAQVDANFGRPNTERTYYSEAAQLDVSGIDPASIERPILIVHGTDDRITPLAIAQGLHHQAKDSELVLVEGGSHMLPVTHAERLAEQITAFVRRARA